MKVLVEVQKEPATQLELRLKSTGMRFVNYVPSPHLQYPAHTESSTLKMRENPVTIEFMDSREIDMLIQMLERFKRENSDRFGQWVVKG